MKWFYVAIPLLAFLFIALTECRHEVRRLKGEFEAIGLDSKEAK